MNKKGLTIVFLLTAVLMGCSADKKEINLTVPTFVPEIESKPDQLSEMLDLDDVKIVDKCYYPKFQEGTVVQNDRYFFYPDRGNRIMRIEKQTGERKCILELDERKGNEVGAQVCLAGDRLFVEYECDIFRCDFDGNKLKKIIRDVDVKKKMSSVLHDKSVRNESGIMSGMQFYNGKLYLFSGWLGIWKLDPDSAEFMRIVKHEHTACFHDHYLYYGDSLHRYIYRLDLETGKKVKIKGKTGKTESDLEKPVLYFEVMVVDNQIYYVRGKNGEAISLYLYCEGEKDEKLFTFYRGQWAWSSYVDSTRVFLEYCETISSEQVAFLQGYDIESHKAIIMRMPSDYNGMDFAAGDVLFYSNRNFKLGYLSTFVIPEEDWVDGDSLSGTEPDWH